MFIEQTILLTYAVTILSETAIIFIIQRPQKLWQWVIGVFLVNSLTHPIVIYLLHIRNTPYVFVELGVIVIELILYRFLFKINWTRAGALSVIANLSSILVGVGVRFLVNL